MGEGKREKMGAKGRRRGWEEIEAGRRAGRHGTASQLNVST